MGGVRADAIGTGRRKGIKIIAVAGEIQGVCGIAIGTGRSKGIEIIAVAGEMQGIVWDTVVAGQRPFHKVVACHACLVRRISGIAIIAGRPLRPKIAAFKARLVQCIVWMAVAAGRSSGEVVAVAVHMRCIVGVTVGTGGKLGIRVAALPAWGSYDLGIAFRISPVAAEKKKRTKKA
jgi:hypothetical protein